MPERGLNTKTIGPKLDYYKNRWEDLNDLPQIMLNKTKIKIKQSD